MEEVKKRPSKTKKITTWTVGILLIWAFLTGFFIFLLNPASSENFREELRTVNVDFPLYYIDELPESVKFSSNSVDETAGVVAYTLTQNGNNISVTQQPRPALMEEVKKIKDIPSPLGKAYIAILGQRSAAFLVTDKTLIIISSTQSLDGSTLETLVRGMVAL